MPDLTVAVHGGAGGRGRVALTREQQARLRVALADSLRESHAVLARGGSAVDAVVVAVCVLEDCDLLNAGRGAVLRSDGDIVLDASVMDGSDRDCGAVAAVRGLQNPIRAARAVLEHSRHVLLVGAGAEAFARAHEVESRPREYFVTGLRERQLEVARRDDPTRLDSDPHIGGTVGAVARDSNGHLAAATSTGGMTNAAPARVGDTPVVGAGVWADDATCAVSATGGGEYFMRAAFAHEVDAGMRLAGLALEPACVRALERVAALGGRGGCVAVDAAGRVVLPCTTVAMPRGCIGSDGLAQVAVLREDALGPV